MASRGPPTLTPVTLDTGTARDGATRGSEEHSRRHGTQDGHGPSTAIRRRWHCGRSLLPLRSFTILTTRTVTDGGDRCVLVSLALPGTPAASVLRYPRRRQRHALQPGRSP